MYFLKLPAETIIAASLKNHKKIPVHFLLVYFQAPEIFTNLFYIFSLPLLSLSLRLDFYNDVFFQQL